MTDNHDTNPNIGGIQFTGEDGSPADNVGSSKGYEQLMAERAAREGKPVDDVKAEIDKPKAEIHKDVVIDPAAALRADQFDIGASSRAALNLPPEFLEQDGWSEEQEQNARQWLESAGANQGTAAAVMLAVNEIARADEEQFAAFEQKSHSWLSAEYGTQKDEALAAAKRVVDEVGGQGLRDYLNSTGLGNHPQIIKEFAKLAERKRYLKRL